MGFAKLLRGLDGKLTLVYIKEEYLIGGLERLLGRVFWNYGQLADGPTRRRQLADV